MMRPISAIGFTLLAMLALAPRPAAAAAITYDFSATLAHGPSGDLGNTAVTGQFTIDFDTATITAFHFLMPGGGEVGASYLAEIYLYTPAVDPADNFVQLAFNDYDAGGTLWLLFRTTLAAFDGSTFYTGGVKVDGGGTGSGFNCRYHGCGAQFGSTFVSGTATPDPPLPAVPEPASLTLLGGGLVTLVAQLRVRRRASGRRAARGC